MLEQQHSAYSAHSFVMLQQTRIFSLNPCNAEVISIYRVIHKSLRDLRPLRYSSRDGHDEGEHVNRGRDTPISCPNLQVLDMSALGDAEDVNPVIKFLPHTLHCVAGT